MWKWVLLALLVIGCDNGSSGNDLDTNSETGDGTDTDTGPGGTVGSDTGSEPEGDSDTHIDLGPCDGADDYCSNTEENQTWCDDNGGILGTSSGCPNGMCCRMPPSCPIEQAGYECMPDSTHTRLSCKSSGGEAPKPPEYRCGDDPADNEGLFCCADMDPQ